MLGASFKAQIINEKAMLILLHLKQTLTEYAKP